MKQPLFLDWISGEVRSRQSACLMVMHDLVLAFRYCDHALLLFGDGSYTKGRREEMMTEENLRLLYGFPVKVCTVGEDFIFLPARSDSPAQL